MSDGLLALFLPLRCLGCGARVIEHAPRTPPLCLPCTARLHPLPPPRCPRCDLPRGTGTDRPALCPDCAEWPAVLAAARSVTALAGVAGTLVHALKYGGWHSLSEPLGRRIARLEVPAHAAGPPVAVVAMPTTAARRRRRGYNQAGLLADVVAAARGLPRLELLARRYGARSQVALELDARVANVRGSFGAGPDAARAAAHPHVILVDDVLTTGATVGAAALVLESLGVACVTALTFARTLPRGIDIDSRS